MQICRRRYDRARKGTIQYQALYRGYATRKDLAAIKVQTNVRMQKQLRAFLKLKSAVIALQCALRVKVAKKVLFELKKEQKDVGKLKQNNEKLKAEMASLRAMLAAQAQSDASKAANEKEMGDKQREIDRLEKRVAQLEAELEQKKALIAQIEEKMKIQKENAAAELNKLQHQVHHLNTTKSHRRSPTPPSPGGHSRVSPNVSHRKTDTETSLPVVSEDMVSPEVLEQHKAQLRKLEDELEAERQHRRAADGEIIKLRAAMGGVQLSDSDVNALLPQAMESLPPAETETIDEEAEYEERLDERYVVRGRMYRVSSSEFHSGPHFLLRQQKFREKLLYLFIAQSLRVLLTYYRGIVMIFVALAVIICFFALTLRRRATQRTLTVLDRFAKLGYDAIATNATVGSSSIPPLKEILSCHI